jgi:hypothetical protein
LASIGELYASLTHVDGLKEDSNTFDPTFRKSEDEESAEMVKKFEGVIEFSNLEKEVRKPQTKLYPTERFISTKTENTCYDDDNIESKRK